MAVWRLGAGARGPHDCVRPAPGAFEFHLRGLAFGQKPTAMAAPDLAAIVRLHGSLHSCAPYNIRLLCAVSLETQKTGGNSARC